MLVSVRERLSAISLAVLVVGCGMSASSPVGRDASAEPPPFTLAETAPTVRYAADSLTLSLSEGSGYAPYEVVRQQTEFVTQPGIAMRSALGTRLRAWLEPSGGGSIFGAFHQQPSLDDPAVTVAASAVMTSDPSLQFTIDVSGDSGALTEEVLMLRELLADPPTPSLSSLSNALSVHGWKETARLDATSPPFGESWATSYVNRFGGGIRTVVYSSDGRSALSTDLASLVFPYTVLEVGDLDLVFNRGGAGLPPTAWLSTEFGFLVLIAADVAESVEFVTLLRQLQPESVDKLIGRVVAADE